MIYPQPLKINESATIVQLPASIPRLTLAAKSCLIKRIMRQLGGTTMSDQSAILLTAAGTIAGVVLGAVSSWYFSRRYYLKSGTDLDAALLPLAGDAQKALQAANTVGRMLEQAGIGKATRDAAGNLTGLVVTATAHFVASSDMNVTAMVKRPPQHDREHEQPPSPESEGDHA
jgi:hypothetical protein